MSQEMMLWVVKLLGTGFALFLLYYARQFYRRRQRQWDRLQMQQNGREQSASELGQKTSRLNPGFFGKSAPPPSADSLPDAPVLDLPLAIMARMGQHFSGDDVAALVQTFGLQASPNGVYELLNENGRDVLFTMLNIHHPGVFARDLEHMAPIDGVLLVLQLPNCGDGVKDWENFLAIAKDMADICNGRLCDHERRQLMPKDLLAYRAAVEKFQREYEQWLAHHQR